MCKPEFYLSYNLPSSHIESQIVIVAEFKPR